MIRPQKYRRRETYGIFIRTYQTWFLLVGSSCTSYIAGVVIVYLVRRHNLKKEQKDLEDQLSDLYAEDSVKENNTRVQE